MITVSKNHAYKIWALVASLIMLIVVVGFIQEYSKEGAHQANQIDAHASEVIKKVDDRIHLELKRIEQLSNLIGNNAPDITDPTLSGKFIKNWVDNVNKEYLNRMGIEVVKVVFDDESAEGFISKNTTPELVNIYERWIVGHDSVDFHWEILFTSKSNFLDIYTIRKIYPKNGLPYIIIIRFEAKFNIKAYLNDAEEVVIVDPNNIAMSIHNGVFSPSKLTYKKMDYVNNDEEYIKNILNVYPKEIINIETISADGIEYEIYNGQADKLLFAREYLVTNSHWKLLMLFDAKIIKEGIEDELLEGLEKIGLTLIVIAVLSVLIYYHYRIRFLIYIDPLTGLLNRGHFNDHIGPLCELHERRRIENIGFLAIDIDKFKHINDAYGHGVGDEVLKAIAKLMRKELRNTEQIYRFGGEEFIILCVGESLNRIVEIAERLRKSIETQEETKYIVPKGFTVSIGVANRELGESIDSVLNRCDTLLYKAKEDGRNKVCF